MDGQKSLVHRPMCCPPRDRLAVEAPEVWPADSRIRLADRWRHLLVRLGYRRSEQRVEPGLYALGQPTPDAPVVVTANYCLSYGAVRQALAGRDAYILVLDTRGINVWYAAGKGTFGTDELVRRLALTALASLVSHRRLVLPQLSASGVAAHEVKRRTGFTVVYGPVRAADLPYFLDMGQATPEMRRVTFNLAERAVLVPVEVVHTFLPMALASLVLWFLAGRWAAAGVVAAVWGGTILFPLLLPWLPTRDFASKGLILGTLLAAIVAWLVWNDTTAWPTWIRLSRTLGLVLGLPPVTGYLALNFTGSTPMTSQSGVKREMFRYLPAMAVSAILGVLLVLSSAIGVWLRG